MQNERENKKYFGRYYCYSLEDGQKIINSIQGNTKKIQKEYKNMAEKKESQKSKTLGVQDRKLEAQYQNLNKDLMILNIQNMDEFTIDSLQLEQNKTSVIPIVDNNYRWTLLQITSNNQENKYEVYNPLLEKDLKQKLNDIQNTQCLFSDTGTMVFSYIQDLINENTNHTSVQNSIPELSLYMIINKLNMSSFFLIIYYFTETVF